jgi:hypothetical protein
MARKGKWGGGEWVALALHVGWGGGRVSEGGGMATPGAVLSARSGSTIHMLAGREMICRASTTSLLAAAA